MKKTHSKVNRNLLTQCIQGLAGWMSLSLLTFTAFAAQVSQVPMFLTTTAKPNIMLMVDNSGSMKDSIAVQYESVPYNSSSTYLKGKCTYKSSKSKNRAIANQSPANYTTSVPSNFLGNGGSSSANKCFDPALTYANTLFNSAMVTMLTNAGVISDKAKKANYLNWYYSDQLKQGTTVSKTRLEVVKEGTIALVDSLEDVRIGLSTFNGDDGGKLLESIDDISDTKKTNVKTAINNLEAKSWTPLAEVQSSIGRYFATADSPKDLTLHPDSATGKTTKALNDVFPQNLVDGTTGELYLQMSQNLIRRQSSTVVRKAFRSW